VVLLLYSRVRTAGHQQTLCIGILVIYCYKMHVRRRSKTTRSGETQITPEKLKNLSGLYPEIDPDYLEIDPENPSIDDVIQRGD
jgi:hypothetical protein